MKNKTVFRRYQPPFLETFQSRVKVGISSAWFLCRVGKEYFTDQVHFVSNEGLQKQGRPEKANTTIGYLYVFQHQRDLEYGLDQLDEFMELKRG